MNAPQRQGISYRPDPTATSRAAATSFIRACCAALRAQVSSDANAIALAEKLDRDAGLILRAATLPNTIATTSALAQQSLASFVTSLASFNAASALMEAGISLSFDSAASILVPNITPPTAAFIGEGAPIPAEQATVGGPILTPFKLATIAVYTAELLRGSPANVEALIGATLREAIASRLDAVLFGTAAASSVAPAGILNGISALTPAAASGAKTDIMTTDLAALVSAIAPVVGTGQFLIVAAPSQAIALQFRLMQQVPFVRSSSALAAGTVICVASNAFASALGPPRIEVGDSPVLHMEDTTPLAIGSVGSPNTVAAPSRSLWQTDCVGLRIVAPVSWALRSSSGVAYMTAVNW